MEDELLFHFSGKLADENKMDFYESARFQYAAARLSVKLDRYRRYGNFPSKVTRASNTGIDLAVFKKGSFDIEILAPLLTTVGPMFIEVPLSALWTYVVERVFKPADSDNIREALRTQDRLIDAFESSIAGSETTAQQTLALLEQQIAQGQLLTEDNKNLRERLVAEVERRAYLQGMRDQLARISPEDDAQLVTMAAPLLKEVSVPLRRSATLATLHVGGATGKRTILAADRAMASSVELSKIDPNISTIRINLIQYNKENGWGKFRNREFNGLASFSISADRKENLQPLILKYMGEPEVMVSAYFVRSLSGVNQRLIIVGIAPEQYQTA